LDDDYGLFFVLQELGQNGFLAAAQRILRVLGKDVPKDQYNEQCEQWKSMRCLEYEDDSSKVFLIDMNSLAGFINSANDPKFKNVRHDGKKPVANVRFVYEDGAWWVVTTRSFSYSHGDPVLLQLFAGYRTAISCTQEIAEMEEEDYRREETYSPKKRGSKASK
jgi:hypothetical protein